MTLTTTIIGRGIYYPCLHSKKSMALLSKHYNRMLFSMLITGCRCKHTLGFLCLFLPPGQMACRLHSAFHLPQYIGGRFILKPRQDFHCITSISIDVTQVPSNPRCVCLLCLYDIRPVLRRMLPGCWPLCQTRAAGASPCSSITGVISGPHHLPCGPPGFMTDPRSGGSVSHHIRSPGLIRQL